MKKRIIQVACILIVIIGGILIVPDPTCYSVDQSVQSEKKNYYSLYQSMKLRYEFSHLDMVNSSPTNKQDVSNVVFGGTTSVFIQNHQYHFYREGQNAMIVLTEHEKVKGYSLLSEEEYHHLSKQFHFIPYENLPAW